MVTTSICISEILTTTPLFNRLSNTILKRLTQKSQLLRYQMGQQIAVKESIPAQVAILYQGQARLIGYTSESSLPSTLKLLKPGAIIGWVSLLRSVPCETVIASTDAVCLLVPALTFQSLLLHSSDFANAFTQNCALPELFELLHLELQRQALGNIDLVAKTREILPQAVILKLPKGKTPINQLEPNRIWLLSSGNTNFAIGDRIEASSTRPTLQVESGSARLVGIPPINLQPTTPATTATELNPFDNIPLAPSQPPALETRTARNIKYPYVNGRGEVNQTLACLQMLSEYWNIPFRRDVVRKVLVNQHQHLGNISLQLCGSVASMLGLQAQMSTVPSVAISRIQTPVMLQWQNDLAILYKASDREFILGIPGKGIEHHKPKAFMQSWGEQGEVLLLQPTLITPQKQFGLSWFAPFLTKYRRVLTEVLIASFFVQIFSLANPLITQTIVDKVLVNKFKKGEPLLILDYKVHQARLKSLQKIRSSLLIENQFYQSHIAGKKESLPTAIFPQFVSLTKNRAALVTENHLLQAQYDGTTKGMFLTKEQQQQVISQQVEAQSRIAAAKSEIEQLQRQLKQAQIQLQANRKKLKHNISTLKKFASLVKEGVISKLQQENQQQEVDNTNAEIARSQEEKFRLQAAIEQAQARVENTKAVDRKYLTTQIASNNQKIAEIDTQLTKAIIENNKRIAETDSQISQTNKNIEQSVVKSPIDGIVFDLKPNVIGFVANSNEPVVKIVPEKDLIASVSITNKDIAFVKEKMPVDVRIDSLPFSEFGDIKGTLISIGSDVLEPTQIKPNYTFPATVRLKQQYIDINGRKIKLKSGMSVSANIKLRKRSILSIFVDDFLADKLESVKTIR